MLLFLSIDNTEKGPGPKSAHANDREAAHMAANSDPEARFLESEKPIQEPDPTHQQPREEPPQTDGAADSTPYAAPAAEITSSTATR